MITFQNVTKQFGSQVVLSDVSFQINRGERAGFVGPNGAGKTTLFELIVGEVSPDKGSVSLPQDGKLGYLRQYVQPSSSDSTLLEFAEDARPDFREIQAEIEALEHAFHEDPEADRRPALRRLGELQTRFEAMGGYQVRNRAEVTLCGLGFPVAALHEPFRT
jgi:ATP-binding cassette, subfamily F, member 3